MFHNEDLAQTNLKKIKRRELWKWHKTDSTCQTGEGRGLRPAREGVVGGDPVEAVTFHILVHEVSVLAGCPQPTWFLLL